LIMVEAKVKESLDPAVFNEISKNSTSESVSSLLDKYLN